ncbi:short-chain dehydrogenase [Pelobium manganitolerans]|uniref:Short-chain dehydrogenase n=1 Tax=Pelobium manganitolerans TaxID=1842495 RepID=A0A419S1U7_9SPHI|nr:SDR family oxidoreductase [Pelobium manganitolerans]RKD12468.1 short-chain dehydrogenase [Pelobium manganitolerans]
MNILITGVTRGIGKATALALAPSAKGMALCARKTNELETLARELKALNPQLKLVLRATDCGLAAEVEAFADEALTHLNRIDVLINNVGFFAPSPILMEDAEQLQKHFSVNVATPYLLYKKIAPVMQNQRSGHIINICSVASIQTIVNAGSYCVTKAALLSLNNIMREETRPFGVKVTAVLPGSTLTSSWDGTEISADKFVQAGDVAQSIKQLLQLSHGANVDQIVITPQSGQV